MKLQDLREVVCVAEGIRYGLRQVRSRSTSQPAPWRLTDRSNDQYPVPALSDHYWHCKFRQEFTSSLFFFNKIIYSY